MTPSLPHAATTHPSQRSSDAVWRPVDAPSKLRHCSFTFSESLDYSFRRDCDGFPVCSTLSIGPFAGASALARLLQLLVVLGGRQQRREASLERIAIC